MSNLISGFVRSITRKLKLGGRRHKKTAKVVAGRHHKKTAGRRHRKH